ncbi:hypothetical protein OQA88_5230 [Cercophora sp. LCS_1]
MIAAVRIRRIKCDQSRPSCEKCRSTGRVCDGYSPTPFFGLDMNLGKTGRTSSSDVRMRQHIPPSLGPLLSLPTTGTAQEETMHIFEHVSILHIDEYHPCESWRNTLVRFSQTAPPVRHAAMALALMHRSYRCPSPPSTPENAPLFHYNKAIQLLLNQQTGDGTEATAITLLTCYLFICFDHLARNYVQAMKHLRGGVHLARSIDSAAIDKGNTSPAVRVLISQLKREIRRLDMQAVTFLVDWTPADFLQPEHFETPISLCQEPGLSRLPVPDHAFTSLDRAADALQPLVARVMWLRNLELQQQQTPIYPLTDQDPTPQPPSSPSQLGILSQQLQTWSVLFEDMLLHHQPQLPERRLVPLLRLHHTISHILLNTHLSPAKELSYDIYTPQFQHCLSLAHQVTTTSEHTGPTLTPSIGLIPVLFIIGVKCRHPVLRRQVVHLLRRGAPMREAVWDGEVAARVVERVVEVEEGGGGSEAEIPVWRRVETVSWVHHVGDEGSTGRSSSPDALSFRCKTAPNASPYVVWSSVGGPNGTIVVSDADNNVVYTNRAGGDVSKWELHDTPAGATYSRSIHVLNKHPDSLLLFGGETFDNMGLGLLTPFTATVVSLTDILENW